MVVPIGEFLNSELWEDGGWAAPLVPGDELHMVGIHEGINIWGIDLPWEPDTCIYTFWLRGLTSVRDRTDGDSRRVSYEGNGILGVYEEPRPGNHDYGVNPPNATVPSTFADGQLVLEMHLGFASVQYNSVLGNAEISLDEITYTGGSFYDTLSGQCGLCVGYASQGAAASAVPGYDLLWGPGAYLQNHIGVPVEPQTWGMLKSQHR